MYQFKTPTAKQKELTLFKGRNDYNKVMKEMNEPPKEYEAIKLLVEDASSEASRGYAVLRDKKIL